jgi:protein-S-isoprenylcysteine O-methyltransferase Ste14
MRLSMKDLDPPLILCTSRVEAMPKKLAPNGSPRENRLLGEEYPGSDQIQGALFILLVVTWGLDSFILKIYMVAQVSVAPRLIASIVLAASGAFLMYSSHKLVIEAAEPTLVDWGVYRVTRHPMYLGIMLFELGLVSSTLSIPALLLMIAIFVANNKFAEYEEGSLIQELSDEYRKYLIKVKRWGLV